jgi:hypothetical protein
VYVRRNVTPNGRLAYNIAEQLRHPLLLHGEFGANTFDSIGGVRELSQSHLQQIERAREFAQGPLAQRIGSGTRLLFLKYHESPAGFRERQFKG